MLLCGHRKEEETLCLPNSHSEKEYHIMKEDRSLLKYVVFSILTLGIYSLFFWHQYANDMNIVCQGDGKNTRGILARILFDIIPGNL